MNDQERAHRGDGADQVVVLHTTIRDARTIAALINSGAAALEVAPARGDLELGFRDSDVRLGRQVAHDLVAEADRTWQRNEARHRTRRTGR